MAMQDLQLIGVHEDGEHLLLSGAEGARFRMPVDEPLRAAIRHDRPRLGRLPIDADGGLRPRDVQALIRAGASAEEAAERAGWSVEKVHRYEGPILAEREHVAGLARSARLRARNGASSGGSAPTLSARVAERLKGRGVDPREVIWDSWRADDGPWTVVLTFAAGGRQRQAAWRFDLADRAVYDLEAEGGLLPGAPADHHDDPIDLMTAMRERTTARSRRRPGVRRGSLTTPTNVPGAGDHAPDEALPLDDLAYDPETMPPPPGAHADPDPLGVDGQPYDDAAGYLIELPEEQVGRIATETARATKPAAKQSRHRAARKGGRPTVPAWDEIMFGSRPGGNRSSS
jgi:hypothetical protein